MIPLETFTAPARDLANPVSARDLAEPIRVSARDLRRIAARLFGLFIRAVDPHVFCLCLAVGVFSDDLNGALDRTVIHLVHQSIEPEVHLPAGEDAGEPVHSLVAILHANDHRRGRWLQQPYV